MSARWTAVIAALVVGAAGFVVWWLWPEPEPEPAPELARAEAPVRERGELLHPQRPTEPPVPGRDYPRPAPGPEAPEDLRQVQAKAYADAVEAGYARPGEVAFRAMIDAFMDYNRAFAEAQAREEGVTVEEVHELTYFGFMVLETQRWPDVEELLERELSPEQRTQGEELMHAANREFEAEIRELVDQGASEQERWALIEATQERYRQDYFELTGMNEDLLDELLAGDPSRSFAPADTPPPEDFEPAEAPPPVEPRPPGPS